MAIVTAHVQAVQQLYVAYFNRPADTAGLDYWTNVVAAQKGSTAAVSAAFAAEAEYKTEYAGLSNADVVNKVYQNLFGRAAEAEGKAYWADLLDKKQITIDKVVAEIAKGAQTTDAEAYENKVAGATAFTAALDTTAEQNGYKGAAANTQAKAFVSGITTDASLTAAIAPATLNATVAKVVAAGTPFTLSSGLAALDAVKKAKVDFLDATDGKVDGKVAAGTEAKIGTDVSAAVTKVDAEVAGYAAATSPTVRAALITDQIAANAKALSDAQGEVATANAAIAKVAGLASAVAALTAATTAATNAGKAVTTAEADLAGKLSTFNVLDAGADVTVAGDGTIAGLIELNADKKLVLASNVTETSKPGITAVLNASIAKEAADAALIAANKTKVAAQASVDYLDMNAAEVSALETLKSQMVDVQVAAGELPTVAQIQAQRTIFAANGDSKLAAFDTAISNYNSVATTNTKVDALTTATGKVTTANAEIEALTKAVDALNKANAVQTQLTAADAAITAATKAFTDNGLTAPTEAVGSKIATGASDIYVAGATGGSINLFGLQGSDSLFIGNKYTLNTGKVATAGDNAVLEVFIAASGTSDTKVYLETSAFGSNAAVPELIEITLVGVDASTVKLNNGIITVVNPTV